jgi:Transcriptional regulator
MLERFKIFLEIANTGNISQAAENLYISQSTASNKLKSMEDEIGVPLFDRVGRKVVLNRHGEVFLKFAKETVQKYEEIKQSFLNTPIRDEADLTVCAGSYFNVHFLPIILPQLFKKYGNMEIHIVRKYSDEVLTKVRKKEYEFGILGTSRPIRSPEICTDFSYVSHLQFVCSPNNPLSQHCCLHAGDLRGETFLFTKKGLEYRQYLESKMTKYKMKFKNNLTIDSLDVIKASVASNLGVTILPQHVVQNELTTGHLVSVPIKGVELIRVISCIHHIEKPLSEMAAKFIELCIEILDKNETLHSLSPEHD